MIRDLNDERTRYSIDFGERLNTMRKNAGMTRRTLCHCAGVSETALQYYISGRSEPTSYAIYRLALALGVSGDELLGLDGGDDD